MRMQLPKPTDEWTEKELQTVLFSRTQHGLAWQLGWRLMYHTYRSSRSPSGFPDFVLARERIIYVELKREGGKPTAAQQEWLTGLTTAGGECYLWLPHDLEEAAAVLRLRYDPVHPPLAGKRELPRSRWQQSGDRMDHFMPELKGLAA